MFVLIVTVLQSAAAADADAPAAPAAPAAAASGAEAATDFWRVVASPWTQHYRYSAEHRHVYALGLERQHGDGSMWGAAYFRNSFGQPSAYAYIGHRYPAILPLQPEVFFQWSAGVIYGYRGKYKDKVPLNVDGFSPGAVITLGWQFDARYEFAAHALGNAGVMFQFSMRLR